MVAGALIGMALMQVQFSLHRNIDNHLEKNYYQSNIVKLLMLTTSTKFNMVNYRLIIRFQFY